MSRLILFSCKGIILILIHLAFTVKSSAEISFNRDILPILSNKCFFCHGPSEKSRKAKLRLDVEEEAFKEKDGLLLLYKKA